MIGVLIADDDSAQRGPLAKWVRSLGYTVYEAADGEEALQLVREFPVDIVVTDWSMPKLTGLELCQRLRVGDSPPYIILMTAFDGGARLVEGMRAGANDFIRKPVDLDELDVRLLAGARMVHMLRRLKTANELLRRDSERDFAAARVDALTGIGNRLALNEELRRAAHNAERYGHPCALAICDIDHFKLFNDRYGHLGGDEALRRVAGTIRDALRTGDQVFRFGGEEFVALLPEQSVGDAARAMDRVRAAVRALAIPHPTVSRAGVLTMSVGVAAFREGVDDWLARADAALYRAKGAGRDCVREDDDNRPSVRVPPVAASGD
jgi:diguanylate cyclase (GGDEF)-like protein